MLKKIGMAALGVAIMSGSILATTSSADAQRRHHHRGHHHGHYHGGNGGAGWVAPAIVGGLALGAIAATARPRCWTQDQVVVDRRGREWIRPVQVCN